MIIYTDIHMFLEYKRASDNVWKLDEEHTVSVDEEDEESFAVVRELQSGRSYELFGHLAGVRYMKDKVVPKGIPSDASVGFRNVCNNWGDEADAHSYVSIPEYAAALDKTYIGSDNWDIKTTKLRDPFTPTLYVNDPFHTVLAYVYDQEKSNTSYHMLTNDPYYDVDFRIVFFFYHD